MSSSDPWYPCCGHCNTTTALPCFQSGSGHPVPCVLPTCAGAHPIQSVREPECNGICLTAADIGLYSNDIAYPHPDCEVHGKYALFELDGTPRHITEETS